MKLSPICQSVAFASILLNAPGARAENSDANAILAQAKAASGGAAWDAVQSLHFHEQSTNGGLTGTQEEWDDVQTGRFVLRFSRAPLTGANGFDGTSIWTQATGGYSYVLGDEDPRQGAVNQAYQVARAFWYSDRAVATFALEPAQKEDGRTFDVIEITPQAGRPFTVWIDQTTHLIDRFVEVQAEDVQIMRLSDYREVKGGIRLPFSIRIGDGDPRWDEADTIDTAEVNPSLKSDLFALPANPKPDFHFANGQTSTTIPFRLDSGKLLVPVKINGQGPFEAEFDSGGDYIIPPDVAKKLNITAAGALQSGGGGEGFSAGSKGVPDRLELGDITVDHPLCDVMELSKQHPTRLLIGLQILQRFVVTLDFDRDTATFTRPENYHYNGSGAIVPFCFQSNQPEVKGAVDGVAGVFAIDTGDDSSLLLIGPFARHHGLRQKYDAVIPYGGHSMGATHGVMTRAGTVSLFGADGRPVLETHHPLTRISLQADGNGFDSDRYVSGNIGIQVLRQFNLTFDYARQRIIFGKNQSYGAIEAYDRTGLQLKVDDDKWNVAYVVAASPAADAGIKVGDQVLTINGQNAKQLDPDARWTLFRANVGSPLTLKLHSAADQRVVKLILRDVL